jgi:hypothetical protein
VWIAALALAGLTAAWRFLEFPGLSNDHYLHLALAQQLLLGDLPVRDFTDPGLPLMYILSAAARAIGGEALWPEWTLVAAAFAIGAACTVFAAARLSGSLAIAVLVTIVSILITPRSYGYPKILVYAAAACIVLTVGAVPRRGRSIVLAVAIAVAFLFRHDHGMYVGIVCAVAVALSPRGEGLAAAVRRVGILTAWVAVLLAPWFAYIVVSGGPIAYFRTGLELSRGEARETLLTSLPRFELNPGRPLFGLAPPAPPIQLRWTPDTDDAMRRALEGRYRLELVRDLPRGTHLYDVLDRSEANVRSLSADAHVEETEGLAGLRRPAWREWLASVSPLRFAPALHNPRSAEAWMFYLFWALPLTSAIVVARRMRAGVERWPGELAAATALVPMAVLVNLGFVRHTLAARIPDAIVPAALLGAWLLGLVWGQPWGRRMLRAAAAAVTLVVFGVTLAASAQVAQLSERSERAGLYDGIGGVGTRARQVREQLALSHREAPASRYSDALLPFYAYLDRCAASTDRLLMTSGYFDVPVAARHGFAGGSVAFSGGHAPEMYQERSVEILRAQSAFIVVMLESYPRFREHYRLVDSYLTGAYRHLADIPVEGAEPVRILVDRNRPASGLDRVTSWPCFR